MSENPAALHVVGVTGTGQLAHTIRTPDGWSAFVDVLGPAAADQPELRGYVTEVTAARVVNAYGTDTPSAPVFPEGLLVAVLVSTQPNPLFFFRYADTGRWVPIGAADGVLGARRIAATAATTSPGVSDGAGEPTARLQMAWTGRGGQLLVTEVRVVDPRTSGRAVTVRDTIALHRDAFRVPAVAGGTHADEASSRLRLAGLTADGRMYRSTVSGVGAAEEFSDVEKAGAGEVGDIVDTAVAVARPTGDREYYAAVTGDGRILLATNNPTDDTWTCWRNLEEAEFVLHAPGATVTYRDVAEFGTFARVALAATTEGLHVLGITTSGRLLHQLQTGLAVRAGDGQEFRDVALTGVGADIGQFTSVAAA